ncbi:MAG: NAD-dependent epimerase/dehydratase family protein [Streptosporangiales bacterium]|nr:NAD-dependent epimerase/dehydratase family protein [Streptosporangiales bacterium]
MTTLVTGVTGRVGSRFVPRLLDRGEEVRVLVRNADRAAHLSRRGADVVDGDLRDTDTLKRITEGVDAVVHLAVVLTAFTRGATDEEAVAVNQTAAVQLAQASLRAGVARFVFASTNLVYGPGRGRPVREDDELRPAEHVYPRSKAAAEEALRELQRTDGLGLRTVRLAFVYGEGDPHLAESLRWAEGWPAHQRLHMIHHADAGQALIRALRAEGVDGRTYNAADDAPVTAVELFDLNDEPVPEGATTRPLDDPWEGIVDTGRVRAELGFRPIYPTVYTAKEAGAL